MRKALISLLAAAAITGCGDDDETTATQPPTQDPAATEATPAGDQMTGAFRPLEGAEGAAISGSAELIEPDGGGTEATIELTGLEPQAKYVGHVHAQACADDQGGPHFMFDEKGEAEPPNEIHFKFTTDGDGAGRATAENPQWPEGAESVVVHRDHGDGHSGESPPKVACADLS